MPLPSLARESAPIECQRSSVRADPSLSVYPITNDYAPPSRNARFLASRVRSACRPDLQDLYTLQRGRYPFGSKGTLPFYAERKASRETSVKLFDLPLGEKKIEKPPGFDFKPENLAFPAQFEGFSKGFAFPNASPAFDNEFFKIDTQAIKSKAKPRDLDFD